MFKKAPKFAQAQKNAKNANPRCNVRGQGLIGLDFCIFCICLEPVQVLGLSGLVFLHFF